VEVQQEILTGYLQQISPWLDNIYIILPISHHIGKDTRWGHSLYGRPIGITAICDPSSDDNVEDSDCLSDLRRLKVNSATE